MEIRSVKAITMEVIKIEACVGAGTPEDPVRAIAQYWSPEGELLKEVQINSIQQFDSKLIASL